MNYRSVRFCPLIFIVLCGCTPSVTWQRPALNGSIDEPLHSTVCIDLPVPEREGAFEAVRLWDRALAQWQHMTPIIGKRQDVCTLWVFEEPPPDDPDDPGTLARTSMIGGHEIVMLKGRYEGQTTGILLHEIGHALGAQHVPGTLMNRSYIPGAFPCPDVTTVAQVAAWNKVDLGLLGWCSR